MKILFRTIFALALAVAMTFPAPGAQQPDDKPADSSLKTDKEKLGYSIGMYFGNQFKRNSADVDVDSLVSGMKDVLVGNPHKLTDAQAQEVIRNYQQAQRAKMEAERAKMQAEQAKVAEKNQKDGEEFLAANKSKSGVKTKDVTLPDGKTAELQYKVLTEGAGDIPKVTDTVQVNYRGTLINGKEFDSSSKHGSAPFEFQVGGVVKGWTEALQMMKVGSKWEVYLPAALAYGEHGFPPDIEPGAALIFEMELVGIKPPAQPLTSNVIRVPSAEELQKGDKIQVLTPEEVEKLKKEEAEKQQQKDKKP